ncbi:hypothetical protein ACMGD3_07360 [Lysinibacillus sphaericus]|uniref:hypothetical protein n=1 Tax=Lysinibacillus sphaericus TaxID=1421 RepID=UPI003F799821
MIRTLLELDVHGLDSFVPATALGIVALIPYLVVGSVTIIESSSSFILMTYTYCLPSLVDHNLILFAFVSCGILSLLTNRQKGMNQF